MSLVVAKALRGAGWFACEVAIPIAVGLGITVTVGVLAAQGWLQTLRRT